MQQLSKLRRRVDKGLPVLAVEGRCDQFPDLRIRAAGVHAVVRKGGELVRARKLVSHLRDTSGAPACLVKLIRDMTECHRMEEALCDAHRQKDEFLAMQAHKLRNPVARIRNALHGC